MTIRQPTHPRPPQTLGEPTWEIAQLYPTQGNWTPEAYLNLDTNHLVEFSDGVLQFLPMPTELHQYLVFLLSTSLAGFVVARGLGMMLTAPMKVKINPHKYREPDILFMLAENSKRRHNKYWDGADLLIEVVSLDNPHRDFGEKRLDYAMAGVSEYWIIDPERRQITVLCLKGGEYIERGVYGAGKRATSALLKGFAVEVSKSFEAADAARKSGGSDN